MVCRAMCLAYTGPVTGLCLSLAADSACSFDLQCTLSMNYEWWRLNMDMGRRRGDIQLSPSQVDCARGRGGDLVSQLQQSGKKHIH